MASAGVSGFRRPNAALCLAGALLLASLLAALLIGGGLTAHADSPVLIVSSSTTNPGGTVMVTGTGWAPAKHYNLYVYGQAKCKPNPTCAPPNGVNPINSSPEPIRNDGTLQEFDFSFLSKASITTYVFTVVADYPTDTPYSASVQVQVVPAGTPPSGTPVSSSPVASPTSVASPTVAASPTASQNGGTTGNQTTPPASSSGSSKTSIILVTILLIIAIGVLIALLIILPPKRRAIRAAWYGNAGGASRRSYPGQGTTGGRPRRPTGGYPPVGAQQPPIWQGGVAQWDEPPRAQRSDRFNEPPAPRSGPPHPPRRPQDRDY